MLMLHVSHTSSLHQNVYRYLCDSTLAVSNVKHAQTVVLLPVS